MNIGTPPSYTTGLIVAANVMSEQNTLSPGFTPASFTAICKAAVPVDKATAYLHPILSHARRSISFMLLPTVESQFVSNASNIYFFISSCLVGLDK